jgi:hypothetical protein
MAEQIEMRRSSARRVHIFRLLTVIASIAVACLLSEAVLRVGGYGSSYFNPFRAFHESDDLIGIRGRRNFIGHLKNREIDVVIENDELGFRKAAHPVAASPARTNVFVLGDSFVWGWGVGQGRVVTDRLQGRLPDCRIKNYGVSATGTVQQFAIFQKFVLPELRRGDAVVLAFYANDFGDNLGVDHPGRLYAKVEHSQIRLVPPDGSACPHGLMSRLSDASYLLNLVRYCSDRLLDSWQRRRDIAQTPSARQLESQPANQTANQPATKIPAGPAPDQQPVPRNLPASSPVPKLADQSVPYLADQSAEVQVAKHYLQAFARECRHRGAELLVVYVPYQAEIGEPPNRALATAPGPLLQALERRALLRCTKALAIPTLDLVPVFLAAKADGKTGRMTIGKDFHWTETGHLVAARAIGDYLATRATSEHRARIALAPSRPTRTSAD